MGRLRRLPPRPSGSGALGVSSSNKGTSELRPEHLQEDGGDRNRDGAEQSNAHDRVVEPHNQGFSLLLALLLLAGIEFVAAQAVLRGIAPTPIERIGQRHCVLEEVQKQRYGIREIDRPIVVRVS